MPPFLHKKHVKRDDLVMYTVEIPTCNFEILHAEKMNCHIAMHLKYCRGPIPILRHRKLELFHTHVHSALFRAGLLKVKTKS